MCGARLSTSLRLGSALPAGPKADRVQPSLPARRGRLETCRTTCSITNGSLTAAMTRGVALKGGLAKGPWPALLHLSAG